MVTIDHNDGAFPVLSEKVDVKVQQKSDVGDDLKKDAVGSVEVHSEDDEVIYLNGEPVVTTGRDVSRFLVDVRDDGEAALTFRSLFLGTVTAGLGASLYQIYLFKPVQMTVSTVFLLLVNYTIGTAWAAFLPRQSWVEGTRFRRLGSILRFFNPGPFSLKEHVVSTFVASTAASGSTAVLNFAVQRLYYDTHVEALTAVLATFSTACFGFGLTGLLRPLTVYPSEMVYWGNLPTVAVFQTLHFDTSSNAKRLKLFWSAFTGMFIYEVIPAYVFPLLNGFNIFCLASQRASQRTIDVFTNLFGGYFFCYVVIMAIYYSNAWNSLSFPMLSTSIFSANGSVYHQSAVFGTTFQLNQTALDEVGLPALTGSNAWANLTTNLSAMRKYKEVPVWWYIILLALSFVAGSFITPFSTLLYARMGNGIATNQLMKMVAGAINPGRPVANLYFSMWSHDVISTSITLAGDLKMGQYLKIPPRVTFLTQVWGTILGAVINYIVMISVVDAQRDILLDPRGTNVWSGQVPQSLNSAAVTWSLAKQLYGKDGPYFYSAWMSAGVSSTVTSSIIVGLTSQVWLRKYHPGWYKKYNYILGGALDGGAQVMIFILSFAVFGASGIMRPFPNWAGNPAEGNMDYCNGNGAFD
ncbi:hypothetical protein C0995_011263 [Termitomyces sp. Mi166|nr:hypothetical protein C0995_011263 [Termitomyces sp. Mi166\